jgi:hypothetical protein
MKDFAPYINCFIALISVISFSGLWPPCSHSQIQFKEVTQASGISTGWGDSFGASWGDLNGDGWPDLWLSNHCDKPALYLNKSDGTFIEVTDRVKQYNKFEQHGAAWADFDNDGDQDLIQIVGGDRQKSLQPNQFFINSNGLLHNKASEYGLDYPLGRGRTPLWFDWNHDGYLDVLVTNMNRSDGKQAPSSLFTQQGNSFKNDNELTIGSGLGSQFAHLFVSSSLARPLIVIHGDPYLDKTSYPNKVYLYDELPFRDIRERIGLPKTDNVFDVSIADFNNDLLNDFFLVTAYSVDRLLIQTAVSFRDSTTTAGMDMPTTCTSVASADFDNDMDIDLYLVCGAGCNARNILYENLGSGTFKAVKEAGGAEGSSYGESDIVATADYNNDGFIDLFVTNKRTYNGENGRNQLFRNIGSSNHWIEIELVGVVSNRDGIGTSLIASTAGVTQMRAQDGGIHRLSQNHQRIHFGLAQNSFLKKLTIQWPSGIVQETVNIPANHIISIVELDLTGSRTQGTLPHRVDFTSNTKNHYRQARYEWDFDSDGTPDSTIQNPSYIYSAPGTYTVKLKVTDIVGRTFIAIRKDYIKILPAK